MLWGVLRKERGELLYDGKIYLATGDSFLRVERY